MEEMLSALLVRGGREMVGGEPRFMSWAEDYWGYFRMIYLEVLVREGAERVRKARRSKLSTYRDPMPRHREEVSLSTSSLLKWLDGD